MKKFLFYTRSLTITLLIVNLFFVSTTLAQTTRVWLPTTGGAWTTGTNWDTGVPVDGDIVIISSNQSTPITAVPTISLHSLTVSGFCSFSGSGAPSLITVTTSFSVAAARTLSLGVGTDMNRVNLTLSSTCTGTINGIVRLNMGSTNAIFTNSGDLTIAPAGRIDDIANDADFMLSATGILRIGSPDGITTTGATGAIQVEGTRTYSTGANYEYNGTASQVTGNVLTTNVPGNLTINNSAGVTLSAPITITGLLTLTNGTLDMANTNLSVAALTGSGNLTHSSGTPGARTLLVTGATSPAAFSGVISTGTASSVALTKSGTGTLTLSGLNTFTGLTTVSAGSILYEANDVLSTGAISVTGGTFNISTFTDAVGTVTLTGGTIAGTSGILTGTSYDVQAGTVSAVLAGAVTLTKTTGGIVTLSGLNTYTGKTIISDGTLSVNTLNNLSVASSLGAPVTGINGTVDISGTGILLYSGSGHSSDRVINLTASGGAINASGSGTLTLTGGITATDFNLVLTGTGVGVESGVIATGNSSLLKNGTGAWTLSGVNTYTLLTTISSGTLKLGASSAAGNGPLGTTASGTSVSVGGILDMNGFSLTGIATEALTLNGTGISGSGALINSSGTAVTYIGPITLASASSIITNAGDINITNATLSGGAGNILTIGGSGNGFVFSNIVNAGVTKSGAGTWTLLGASTYTGATTVNGGTLKAGVATLAFGTGSNVTLANTAGAVLDITGFNNTIGSLAGGGITGGNVTLGSSTLTAGNTTNTAFAGIISGTGGITKAGSGTWAVTAPNTYTGKTIINEGTLSITSIESVGLGNSSVGNPTTVADGTIDISGTGVLLYTGGGHVSNRVINLTGNNATINASGTGGLTFSGGVTGATFNLILSGTGGALQSGVISTSGTVTKSGTGLWILAAANTYTGLTTISAGTLRLGASSTVATSGPLGTTASGTSISAGGVLDMDGFSLSIAAVEPLTLNGTGISGGGALTNGLGNAVTYIGPITLATASSIITNAGDINITNATLSGVAGNILTLGGSGNGFVFSNIANAGVTKTGTGTWTLSGASTYNGATTVNGGILKAGVATQAFGTGSNVTLANTAGVVLDITGFNNTIASLAGGGITGGNVSLGGATLTTGDIANTVYNGIISGTGGVTKVGSGMWTVTALNTYIGATTINDGIMSVAIIGNGGVAGNIGAANIGAANLVLGGGTLQYTGATASTNRNFTLAAFTNSSIDITANNLTISGGSAGTIGALTKIGAGTLTLSGSNAHIDGTTLIAGTLNINSANALGNAVGTFTIEGGIIDNTSPGDITTLNYPIVLNGDFTYAGSASRSLNLGIGDVTMNGDRQVAVNSNTLTIGGIINSPTFSLTKTGAGQLSFIGSDVTLKNLTISAGILVSTSGTLNLAGDYNNNAGTSGFTHNSGNVNFNGTVAQTIGGSAATTFNNLFIDNTAGVSLTNSLTQTVDATLTLTNGNLTIPTGFTLIIANGNEIAGSGFGTAKHIITEVNTVTGAKGFLRVNNMTPSTYLFPIGSAASYLPVTLTPSDATFANNTFNVCSFPGITANGEPNGTAFTTPQKNNCVDAVWTVNYNGPGSPISASADMTVAWPAALEGINFTGFSNLTIGIAHWDNPNWGTPAGSGNNTANTATRTDINTFSPFGVGSIAYGALPIMITYFNAAKGNGYNTLNWQANCSSAQATFEVLRSTDGINFAAINSITASQARCALPFNYIDNQAPSGTVFYRLRAMDVDGKSVYSAIVKLSSPVKDIELSGISPNPVVNAAQLKINTTKKDIVDIAVISMDGKVVYRNSVQLQPGITVVNVDIANLPAGMYMIKGLFSDGQTNTLKFIKK